MNIMTKKSTQTIPDASPHPYRHHHHFTNNYTSLNDDINYSSLFWAEKDVESQISSPNRNKNFSIPLSFINGDLEKMYLNGTEDNPLILPAQNDSNPTVNGTISVPDTAARELIVSVYSVVIPPMLCLCAITAIVNIIIAISAFWCRKPMSPTLYFSISLALADAYASVVLGLGLVISSLLPIVYHIPTHNCLKLGIEAFRLGGILVIISHLLALAINHWIGIIRPLHYAATMTRRMAWMVIIGSWMWPILLFFIYFSSVSGQGFQSDRCENWDFLRQLGFRGFFASFFFPPLLVMSLIYIHIFFVVKRHQNQRLRYQANDQNSQQLLRNVKAIVTTVLILGTYTIGWMPATLFYIIVCDDCHITSTEFHATPLTLQLGIGIAVNALVILKVFMDPIIYAARMADIQFALKKMKFDILSKCFGHCLPAAVLATDPMLERGLSRTERSLNETKSFRVSSFGSGSSTRRPFLHSTSLSPAVSMRQVTKNNFNRQACNSNTNGHTKHLSNAVTGV